MTRINLLDWRAERRKQRQDQFIAMVALAAIVGVVTVLAGIAVMASEISNQHDRNEYLKKQIAEVDKQITEIQELEKVKASLLARMKVIEQLQQSRSATVHFFDEIVNTLPDGVYITSLKQTDQTVTIDGVAESNGRVSTYMKNLDSSPWFADPQLVVIKTSDKDKQRSSQFTLKVKNLTKATDAKKAAGGGDAQ
jgi:type IV pilus assembly protein PilN